MCFCFNATAPTEIYTYLHTLSLPVALPISGCVCHDCDRAPQCGDRVAPDPASLAGVTACLERSAALAQIAASGWGRSEEHTSELQSLMRISYAVFCLKKKKKEK